MSKALKVLEISRKPDAVMQEVPSVSSSINGQAQVDWFLKFLKGVNTNKQYVVFIVRSSDQSFDSFKRARAHAWLQNINVAYEIFDNNETIRMGEGIGGSGQFPRPQ